MIGAVGPVATIFFGWLLLNEQVSIQQIIGAALVLSGVILVARKPAPKPVAPAAAPPRGRCRIDLLRLKPPQDPHPVPLPPGEGTLWP